MPILPGRGVAAAYRQGVIDTHCHLTFPDFADRIEKTIQEAEAAGVDGLITICTTTQNADECVHVADRHELTHPLGQFSTRFQHHLVHSTRVYVFGLRDYVGCGTTRM